MTQIARPLLTMVLLLASAEGRAQIPGAPGSVVAPAGGIRSGAIKGVVSDSVGTGIVGATVSLVGVASVSITSDDGAFHLAGVPAGQHLLVARRIGFRPESLSLAVVTDSTLTTRVRLISTAQKVAPVVITASRARYTGRLAGFHERRDRGMGRFFTAADIDQRNPRVVTDMLRSVPGIRVTPGMVNFRGRRCAPLVWLDGVPASTGYLDVDLFNPSSLAGIEIYLGPSTIPSQFTWVRGKADCGVIALWTKLPEMRDRNAMHLSVKELEALLQSSQLFTAELVDTPVAPDSAHPITPVFPDSLYRAAMGGRVVAEFVVDVDGRPNMGTFSAVSSTHALFTEAVRGAVSGARFTPAWRSGKRVRQLVQLPFAFVKPGAPGS